MGWVLYMDGHTSTHCSGLCSQTPVDDQRENGLRKKMESVGEALTPGIGGNGWSLEGRSRADAEMEGP